MFNILSGGFYPMKTLVIFYSRSNNTRSVAKEIKNILDCDLEEVIDSQNRKGALGYIHSAINAIRKKPAIINEIKNDLSKYDLIIIGTPVWTGKMSTPIRMFIAQNHAKFKSTAFFCTATGPNFDGAFTEMEELSETTPLAKLGLRGKEIGDGSYKSKVDEFTKKLSLT